MPKICIASASAPRKGEQFDAFVKILISEEKPGVLEIKGLTLGHGRYCWNYGILVEGSDWENWANQLTNTLAGKWSVVSNDDPGVTEGVFQDVR